MAWIDPALFEEPDPFTRIMDAFVTKLKMTADPFGAKYLNQWADLGRRGGLKIFSYDGSTPVNYQPPRDRTPAIVMFTSQADAPEPFGEGDKRIHYVLNFEGWLYTDDQREGNSFYWRGLAALGMPWMQPIDPVSRCPFVHRYWPIKSIGPRPFPLDGQGMHPLVWEVTIDVELSSESFPFFRGI